jgi:hypothetical protein
MKDGIINMVDLDFEYKLWKNRLAFFLKEIEILRHRNETVRSEPAIDALNPVELMVLDDHEDQLTKLFNRIKVQEQEMQFYNKDFPITSQHQYYLEHVTLRKKMESISKVHFDKVVDLVKELGI